ncbi:MAG: GNAT family N-acetyltransferase [Porticoccaceae bacterium]|nr:GNAT family N-acetyltransferase [Porticoccaceae bacterium]
MIIRRALDADFSAIWPIFQQIVAAGDTYAYDRDISEQEAKRIWIQLPERTFLIEENNKVLATYYIKKNQAGPGAHVCNCGYMVAEWARGRGLATALCEHSQQIASELGYKAMQFNFVAATNGGAISLWEKLGFATVGCLPRAFEHPSEGFVDALVMYKWLAD